MQPPEAVKVRRATMDDFGAVHDLHVASFPAEVAFAPEVLESLMRHSQATAVVAETDRVVGFGVMVQSSTDMARLWTLHVDPAARGRGVGRAVLDELHRILIARRVREVELEVWLGNRSAIDLYRAAGYKTVDRNDEAFTMLDPPGSWVMRVRLPGAPS